MEFEFQCVSMTERERGSRIWTSGNPGIKNHLKKAKKKHMQIC